MATSRLTIHPSFVISQKALILSPSLRNAGFRVYTPSAVLLSGRLASYIVAHVAPVMAKENYVIRISFNCVLKFQCRKLNLDRKSVIMIFSSAAWK